MKAVILAYYLLTGVVVKSEHPNGDKVYAIPSIEVSEAYKSEVLNWIETKEFEYNETLEPSVN